jgi:dipeptidyl-peptidase-4
VLDLWAAPIGAGEPFKLIDARALVPDAGELSEAEKARRERMRISCPRRGRIFSWDEQGRYILAPLEGDIYPGQPRRRTRSNRLTETPADEIDAKVSPEGQRTSPSCAIRIWSSRTWPPTPRRRSPTDGEGLITWATAEFIAQEEMDRDTGYWWSPDEHYIALQRTDESGVDVVPRLDINASGSTVVQQRYPRAGRPNAVVDLYVHDVTSGKRIKVDLGEQYRHLSGPRRLVGRRQDPLCPAPVAGPEDAGPAGRRSGDRRVARSRHPDQHHLGRPDRRLPSAEGRRLHLVG